MNKKLTKIVGVTLGLSMAVGAGAGVALSSNKQTRPVYAETSDYSFTPDQETTGSDATSYITTLTEFTHSGISWKMNQWNPKTLQIKTNQTNATNEFRFYNTSAFSGAIKRVVISFSAFTVSDASKLMFLGGSSQVTATTGGSAGTWDSTNKTLTWTTSGSDNFTYFAFYQNGKAASGTNNLASSDAIVVTYEDNGGGGDPTPTITNVGITGDINRTYTSGQSWGISTLSANVTMSDGSDYEGSVSFTCDPVSPGEYVKNNGGEVSDGTVRVTANASGVTGYKDFTGINITYANVAQITAATPASGTLEKVVAKGIVSQIDEVNTSYGNATYYISDDGTTTNQYEVYRGKGVNNVGFTNANDIKVGDIVVVYGNITTHNTTKEFASGNYLLSLDRPVTPDPTITISDSDFRMNVGDEDVTLHETHANNPAGSSIKWFSEKPAVATVNVATGAVHAIAPGTSKIIAKIVDGDDNELASNFITVTVVENVLSNGDTFIVKCTNNEKTYYFTQVVSNIGQYSETKTDAAIFTAEEGATSGQFYLKFGELYLKYTGSENKIYTSETKTEGTLWIVVTNGTNIIIESVSVPGRNIRFNTNSGQERFCCYTSASNIDIETVEIPLVNSISLTPSVITLEPSDSGNIVDLFNSIVIDQAGGSNKTVNDIIWSSDDDNVFCVVDDQYIAGDTHKSQTTIHASIDGVEYASATVKIINPSIPSINYEKSAWVLVNDPSTLVAGDKVILTGVKENVVYAAGTYSTGNNVPADTEHTLTVSGNVVTGVVDSMIYTLEEGTAAGSLAFKDSADMYLYAAGATTKNYMKTQATISDNASFILNSNGTVVAQGSSTRNYMRYNKDGDSNLFACYGETSTVGSLVKFYKLANEQFALDLPSCTAIKSAHDDAGQPYMNLGISLSEDDWNAIDSAFGISGYGVMLVREATLESYGFSSIEEAYYSENAKPNLKDLTKASETAPQDFSIDAKINITKDSNRSVVFCAAVYVISESGHYYFINEVRGSLTGLLA